MTNRFNFQALKCTYLKVKDLGEKRFITQCLQKRKVFTFGPSQQRQRERVSLRWISWNVANNL